MESIVRRLLMAISVLGLITGAWLCRSAYIQNQAVFAAHPHTFYRYVPPANCRAKQAECPPGHEHANDRQDASLDPWNKADDRMGAGIFTMAGSIALRPLYFLARRIFRKRRWKPEPT